ncbi:MAG: hypothetical protein AAB262_00235, partial [Elusimicrobiota bacterium]
MADVRRRFRKVSSAIRVLVVEDDAFGLEGPETFTINTRGCEPMTRETHEALNRIAETILEQSGTLVEKVGPQYVKNARQVWRFETDEGKTGAFRRWLKEQVDAGIVSSDSKGRPWTSKYIDSAYKKGAVRAFEDAHRGIKSKKPVTESFLGGMKTQFSNQFFGASERT